MSLIPAYCKKNFNCEKCCSCDFLKDCNGKNISVTPVTKKDFLTFKIRASLLERTMKRFIEGYLEGLESNYCGIKQSREPLHRYYMDVLNFNNNEPSLWARQGYIYGLRGMEIPEIFEKLGE